VGLSRQGDPRQDVHPLQQAKHGDRLAYLLGPRDARKVQRIRCSGEIGRKAT
jgi:hypothetical protein